MRHSRRVENRHYGEQKLSFPPQLENETKEQYQMFIDYLDYGLSRRLKIISNQYDTNLFTMYAFAKKFNWMERVTYYDKKENEFAQQQIKLHYQQQKIYVKKIMNAVLQRANETADAVLMIVNGWDKEMKDFNKIKDLRKDQHKDIKTNIMILQFLESYTRLCKNIDKYIEKVDKIETETASIIDIGVLEDQSRYQEQLDYLEEQINNPNPATFTEQLQYMDKIPFKNTESNSQM